MAVFQAKFFHARPFRLGQEAIEVLIYIVIGFAEIGYVFDIRQ